MNDFKPPKDEEEWQKGKTGRVQRQTIEAENGR